MFFAGFLFTWIAPGFFAWAISSLNHRCLDDRQSLERARHELKKKVPLFCFANAPIVTSIYAKALSARDVLSSCPMRRHRLI